MKAGQKERNLPAECTLSVTDSYVTNYLQLLIQTFLPGEEDSRRKVVPDESAWLLCCSYRKRSSGRQRGDH